MELDDETIAKLKAEHGNDLRKFAANGHTFVCKMPNASEFDRFIAAVADEERQAKAPANLFHTHVVWPPKPELATILKEQPGLAFSIGSALAKEAGITRNVEAGKL
jgi:hypothetical protein